MTTIITQLHQHLTLIAMTCYIEAKVREGRRIMGDAGLSHRRQKFPVFTLCVVTNTVPGNTYFLFILNLTQLNSTKL